MADKPKPNLASGQDEQTIIPRLDALLTEAEIPPHRRWELVNEGKGIKRSFQFKTFNKTWAFMQAVAAKCKENNHHPEWWNLYNKTWIEWTTHRPEGLTAKDVDMAKFCDEQARLHGELDGDGEGSK